jgi:hypothetical protein
MKTANPLRFTLGAVIVLSFGNLCLAADEKSAKRTKLKWKDVQVVETEPKVCEFIEKIDKDSNSFFTFSGKGFKEKALKGLKKKAGKLGANTVFITDKMIVGEVLNYEAKIYYCTEEQKVALSSETPTGENAKN